MARKKTTKARKRVRAIKQAEPTSVVTENEWAQFEPAEYKNAPHSFIIHRGKVGRSIKELLKDIRLVMEPYTASKLQMKKGNVLKDYVSIASYFHVTHMCILTRTQISPYLKVCRIPRGPTLTFRILDYTLARDVLSSLRKQVTYDVQFQHHPLLIMNNFNSESNNMQLISTTFQNMFPPININKVRLRSIRRVLLLNYNEEDDTIDLRHYTLTYRPVGVSKGVKKLLLGTHSKVPNLGRCKDISEYFDKAGDISESEAEDTAEAVEVKQKLSARGTKGVDEVAIKLVELGPRLTMQLIKVEDGLADGEILYHKLTEKTPEEKLRIRKKRNLKMRQKEGRKREQKMNIEKKKKAKVEHKKRCLEGMGMKPKEDNANNEEDDDAEWYRKEVGQEPDEGAFTPTVRPKRDDDKPQTTRKRFKRGDDGYEPGVKRQKVSKFAKVKEKARLMKRDRQRAGVTVKGRGLGRSGGFKGKAGSFSKGSRTYSKPSNSRMSKKKM